MRLSTTIKLRMGITVRSLNMSYPKLGKSLIFRCFFRESNALRDTPGSNEGYPPLQLILKTMINAQGPNIRDGPVVPLRSSIPITMKRTFL